jgi:RNA polymerase sigma-54 factor
MIKKLVSQEDPRSPLSDNHITQELVNRGIRVARRTVAKYRESMTIPPAHERRRLDQR